MNVIHGRPPNFEAIVAVFPLAVRTQTIFAYAPDIYTMAAIEVPPDLVAHETVHIKRQKDYRGDLGRSGVDGWWAQYLTDPRFRYDEEVLAHRAEYKWLQEHAPSRQVRRQALKHVATKLAAPLYGFKVSLARAMEDIRHEQA